MEDKNGWTPLHHAVRYSAVKAIEFLLDNGVIDNALNKQREAPVHLAIVHNQPKALEVGRLLFFLFRLMICIFFLEKFLLTKRPEHVNLGGEHGRTPLHYAALTDNIDAAKILVKKNSSF